MITRRFGLFAACSTWNHYSLLIFILSFSNPPGHFSVDLIPFASVVQGFLSVAALWVAVSSGIASSFGQFLLTTFYMLGAVAAAGTVQLIGHLLITCFPCCLWQECLLTVSLN